MSCTVAWSSGVTSIADGVSVRRTTLVSVPTLVSAADGVSSRVTIVVSVRSTGSSFGLILYVTTTPVVLNDLANRAMS